MTTEQILANPSDEQIRRINNTCCNHYCVPAMIHQVHSVNRNGNVIHGLIITLEGHKSFIQVTRANDPYSTAKHKFNADNIQYHNHNYYSIGGYISRSLTGAVDGALAILHNRCAEK